MSFFIESDTTRALRERLQAFMDQHIYPNERLVAQEAAAQSWDSPEGWTSCPTVERLKALARAQGLWNLFLPHSERAPEGLSNFDYAPLCEIMGRVHWASAVFNCNAPDTGNMETLERYASEALKDRWLAPLLRGEIRSAFLMTEPAVASSDATNIQTSMVRDGDHYIVNGTKWWSSGVGDPRCKVAILMGKTNPESTRHTQQSMMILDMEAPGVKIERMLSVYGYDHAPHGHGEVVLTDVKVPAENILLGEGRGFEIAQGRLGPGRIHHCMRTIGVAETAIEAMAKRLLTRVAFGKRIADHSVWEQRIAKARIDIEMTRLLCLKAADMMDKAGNKAAQLEIAMIKVAAPNMALQILDDAIQAHGGGGVSQDFHLAHDWAAMRTLRFADGPDEVHNRAIARNEFGKYADLPEAVAAKEAMRR